TRRKFLGSAAAATALSTIPLHFRCASPNRSSFGSVQIGAITYSFRGISGVPETLQACIDSGLGSVELMSTGIEQWAGAPEVVRAPRRQITPQPSGMGAAPAAGAPQGGAPQGGMGQGQAQPGGGQQQQPQLSEEEFAAQEKAAAESQAALREWRLTDAWTAKYTELRKMYNDAGILIPIVKFSPASWSDEEIDYAFKAAKVFGAQGVTEELGDAAAQKLGPIAEKNGMYAIFHNHAQFGDPAFSADPMLAYSPANMLNFDIGHYYGTTGLNPCDFIEKYHDRIFSLHLKDKTGPNTEPRNTNQVWGEGETPLAEVLLLLKQHINENGWPKYGDIELEYPIPAWSTAAKEVKNCVNFARQILI
ncbi:sugar phosphate isomerase/epimerase, partial [bacterium]|nr:sugar phosphate isomerase/epimerase [bacterium]